MKYKIGDKVKIKSLEWYNSLKKDSDNDVYLEECDNYIAEGMIDYLGKTAIIECVDSNQYWIDLDNGKWRWTDEMFEDENKEDITKTIDWEQRRYELAKASMQGMLSNNSYDVYDNSFSDKNEEIIASLSIKYADELIKQLKNNEAK